MKLFMDKYRSASGLEMTEEDAMLTSGDAKVSFKSNLNQKDMVRNVSFGNIGTTPGGFVNIGTPPGGAISLLPSVAPPNDLILVTDRSSVAAHIPILTSFSPLLQQVLAGVHPGGQTIILPDFHHQALLALLQLLTTGVATSLDSQLVVELHQLVETLGLQIQIHQQEPGMKMKIPEPGPSEQIHDLRVQIEDLGRSIQIQEPVQLQQSGQDVQQAGLCTEIQQSNNPSEQTNQQTGKVKQEKLAILENVMAVENDLKEGKQLLKHKQEANVGIVPSQNDGSLDVKREKPVALRKLIIKDDCAKELLASDGPSLALEEPSLALEDPSLALEDPSLTLEDPSLASGTPALDPEEPAVDSEEPVLAAWKLRRLTIRVKRAKLNQSSGQDSAFRDSGTPVVFDDSEEETGSPIRWKPSADEKIARVDKDSVEEKEGNGGKLLLPTDEKKKLEPVLMLSHQRERQKFITRSIINGIRSLTGGSRRVQCSECQRNLDINSLLPHYRRHALIAAAVPKVRSIVHLQPSSSSPPKKHLQQHSFTPPPPPAPISAPAPPASPTPPALLPSTSSNPAASFADFLLRKVTQSGEQQNMQLEKKPWSVAPPSPRPSSCSSLASTTTLEEMTNVATQPENILEDTACASSPLNTSKLEGLQLDLADYEKLLRAKMHKNLRKKKIERARGSSDTEVIVTEQEIDEEIGKESKDKAEDYRKLKYYQVWKQLYDLQYNKNRRERRKGIKGWLPEKIKIKDDAVIAEIFRERQENAKMSL